MVGISTVGGHAAILLLGPEDRDAVLPPARLRVAAWWPGSRPSHPAEVLLRIPGASWLPSARGALEDLCWSEAGQRSALAALKGAGQAQLTLCQGDSPGQVVAQLMDRAPQLAWARRVLFVLRGPPAPHAEVRAAWLALRHQAPEGRWARVFACGKADQAFTGALITGALAGRRLAVEAALRPGRARCTADAAVIASLRAAVRRADDRGDRATR